MLPRFKTLVGLAGHPCQTLLRDILVGHSCLTLLKETAFLTLWSDTLAGHSCATFFLNILKGSCWTLLSGTLAWQSCQALLRGHSFLTVLSDTHAGHSFLTLLVDTLERTLLGTLAWHSCWGLLLNTLAGRSFLTLSLDTLDRTLLLDTHAKSENPDFQNEHFPRDFRQKWESKLPKQAFSTRLSPKVTIQASKTSIFHETSRKNELLGKHSSSQIPVQQRDSTPLKLDPETSNPIITATQTCHFPESLQLCSEITYFQISYNVLCLPRKMPLVTFPKT